MIVYIANELSKKLTIDTKYNNEQLWLRYALEIIISSAISILIIIIGGFFCDRIICSFLYFLFLIPLRKYTGGYHANTHCSCIIITTGTFYLSLFLSKIIQNIPIYAICIEYVIGIMIIIKICPINSPNKIISKDNMLKYKKISIKILTIESVLCCILNLFESDFDVFCFNIILSVLIAVIIGYLKYKKLN